MKAKITITPKAAILDPQGQQVQQTMEQLGYGDIRRARVGKYLELELGDDTPELRNQVQRACREFLSNPVIEDFQLDFE